MDDARLKEFYQLIGQCIKAWATVEDKLFDICEMLLKTDRHFVSVIFFRSPTISARLELTNDLLEIRFPKIRVGNQDKDQPVIVEWRRVKRLIGDLLPARNSLAHDPVIMNIYGKDQDDGHRLTGLASTHSFETSPSAKERMRGRSVKQVRDTELDQLLQRTNTLSNELQKFIENDLLIVLR